MGEKIMFLKEIKENREKEALLQLVELMDGYQTELVLSFVSTLFGRYDGAEEVRKAA